MDDKKSRSRKEAALFLPFIQSTAVLVIKKNGLAEKRHRAARFIEKYEYFCTR